MIREPLRNALEVWQERQDSNLRPAVLETAALPAELRSCAVRRLRFYYGRLGPVNLDQLVPLLSSGALW